MFISQMSPFSMNGLPSPGYQCPTSVYQPTSQQVYSLSQTGQQVLYVKLMKILVFMVKKISHQVLSIHTSLSLCLSVQLVDSIAMSHSTTKVYSHNLAWHNRNRSCSRSLSPSQSTLTGQCSKPYLK